MTNAPKDAVPLGLADLPLEARRARDIEAEREVQEGIARRHLAMAREERAFAAASFATLLRVGPALTAKLRGG